MVATNTQNWTYKRSNVEYNLSEVHIEDAVDIINRWRSFFPKENSWVQRNYGVPSLFVRLDCVVNENGLQVYEIEERPSGLGITNTINKNFSAILKRARFIFPDFKVLISKNRSWEDDSWWNEKISFEEALRSNSPLLIRAEPDEENFHMFESRSISSLKEKGNKCYGEAMGWWRKVTKSSDLNWEEPFCLKILKGSKAKGIEIWNPDIKSYQKKGIYGLATRSRIEKTLSENGSMYYQPFIAPMDHNGELMIFRVFFLYNPNVEEYRYAGGFYNTRKSFKIHGASDTTFGPVN